MAECAYAAIYAMRDPKGKTVADMFPMLFEDDEEEDNFADFPEVSDEDRNELMELIRVTNEKRREEGNELP